MDEKRTYPEGVPSWIDIEQPDLDAAQAFYGGLFGWTFEPRRRRPTPPRVRDRHGSTGARPPGSARAPRPARTPRRPARGDPGWNTYVAVDRRRRRRSPDHRGRRAGDRAHRRRRRRRRAVDGRRSDRRSVFRLWQARRRAGVQVVNQPGAWNFSRPAQLRRGIRGLLRRRVRVGVRRPGFATLIRCPGTATTSRRRSIPTSANARPAT